MSRVCIGLTLLLLAIAKSVALILFLRHADARDALTFASALNVLATAGLALLPLSVARGWRRRAWLMTGLIAAIGFGLPAARFEIQALFVPEPGLDHGDWRGDIPEMVEWGAFATALALASIRSMLPSRLSHFIRASKC